MATVNDGEDMILDVMKRNKRTFDVNSTEDVKVYRKFVINKSWGSKGCPFTIEYPYLSIPDMIKDKLVKKHLKLK